MTSSGIVVELAFGRRGRKEVMQATCACQVASNKVSGMLPLYYGGAEWNRSVQPTMPFSA